MLQLCPSPVCTSCFGVNFVRMCAGHLAQLLCFTGELSGWRRCCIMTQAVS